MKKVIALLLFSMIIAFADQPAIGTDCAELILKDDGSWMLDKIPDEAKLPLSPYATTYDTQLVLLHERTWEYISPDETVGVSHPAIAIAKPTMPYYRVEKKPLIRVVPKPEYPIGARSNEGMAVVKVLVDTDGVVIDVGILQSSGYVGLDQAAIKAAWYARFTPAIYHGMSVRVWVSIPIRFKLLDD